MSKIKLLLYNYPKLLNNGPKYYDITKHEQFILVESYSLK